MIPPVCFSCGHLLADIQIPYERDIEEIINNNKLTNEEKDEQKSQLLDKYNIKRYCCRSRVITYVKLIDIII